MTKEQFEYITQWQRDTFKKATAESATKHLLSEVIELINAIRSQASELDTTYEFADCFLLLFGAASLYGMTYQDICEAIACKMSINKQRTWGEPNEEGYVEHIKE